MVEMQCHGTIVKQCLLRRCKNQESLVIAVLAKDFWSAKKRMHWKCMDEGENTLS